MAYEDVKRNRARKESLGGTFGPVPVEFLVHNKMFTTEEKKEIVEIAKKDVLNDGRGRIYWSDLQYSIRQWRLLKAGNKSEIRKKAEEELKGYDFS